MSDELRSQFDGYIGELFAEEDEVLAWIREAAERNEMPIINVQPFDGHLLQWLARLVGAVNAVEIGTLAGYSGTWIARALPDNGHLFTLELEEKHAEVARASFDKASLNHKVTVIQGAAMPNLEALSERGPFDFVFIDADKEGYPQYLDWAIENLRSGGVVTAHNTYRRGGVLNPENESDRAVHQFNQKIAREPRLDSLIIPLGDGMAVGVKR